MQARLVPEVSAFALSLCSRPSLDAPSATWFNRLLSALRPCNQHTNPPERSQRTSALNALRLHRLGPQGDHTADTAIPISSRNSTSRAVVPEADTAGVVSSW